MSALRLTLAALLCGGAAPALADDFAVTNAVLAIGDGSAPIQNGTVVVRAGKVVAAGAGVAVPAGVRVIDAQGQWVTPGLVVAVTDLGLRDVEAVDDSNDTEADKSPFSAALDISAAINPDDLPIQISRAGGVTRSAVAPLDTDSIFAGQGAVIDLGADPDAVTAPRAFQYVELGEAGAKKAGGGRVAVQAALRNAFAEARELARRAGIAVDATLASFALAAVVRSVHAAPQHDVHVVHAHPVRRHHGAEEGRQVLGALCQHARAGAHAHGRAGLAGGRHLRRGRIGDDAQVARLAWASDIAIADTPLISSPDAVSAIML